MLAWRSRENIASADNFFMMYNRHVMFWVLLEGYVACLLVNSSQEEILSRNYRTLHRL